MSFLGGGKKFGRTRWHNTVKTLDELGGAGGEQYQNKIIHLQLDQTGHLLLSTIYRTGVNPLKTSQKYKIPNEQFKNIVKSYCNVYIKVSDCSLIATATKQCKVR